MDLARDFAKAYDEANLVLCGRSLHCLALHHTFSKSEDLQQGINCTPSYRAFDSKLLSGCA